MRRMLVSRSSFEKPRPFERLVRTSSPSRTSAWRPRSASSACSRLAIVDLPAPERPVSQITKPNSLPPRGGGPGSGRTVFPSSISALRLCSDQAAVGQVQPTLLDVRLLPPPAARALVLARRDRPGARRAADGCVATFVQRVVVQPVLPDVRPDLVPTPCDQRRDLRDAAVRRIGLDHRRAPPAGGLIPPQPRHPRVESRQRAGQRAHLAHLAAPLTQLDRPAEEVRTLDRD